MDKDVIVWLYYKSLDQIFCLSSDVIMQSKSILGSSESASALEKAFSIFQRTVVSLVSQIN